MKKVIIAAVALTVAACSEQQNSQTQANESAPEATRTYSGSGKVTAIAGRQVSIAHGPIPEIGWPAMTMTFSAPGGLERGLEAGDNVRFWFRQEDDSYVLTSLRKG